MPLDELKLDDLTWDDLVQVTRNRIPAASRGQWTLHAPVDPGITLLELFAAQLEEQLYWLDQPCDSRARAILKLLGVKPKPATAAATVLAFGPMADFVKIPRRTPMSPQPPANQAAPTTRGGQSPYDLTFTTRHDILYFPMTAKPELIVGGENRTLDLQRGAPVRLWIDCDGGAVDVDIILPLDQPLPPRGRGSLSILLDLETPTSILPEWVPGAVALPPPAQVTWWYGNDTDGFLPFSPNGVKDGTSGLRRSGVVRLPIRGNMNWPALGDNRYQIRLRIRDAHFAAPPSLLQVVANAAIATHRRRVDAAEAGAGKLVDFLNDWNNVQTPQPTWSLPSGVKGVLPQTARLLFWKKQSASPERWRPVDDLLFSTAGNRHFQIDREKSQVRFGDGYHGRLPVNENERAVLTFDVGGGQAGNLSSGRAWESGDLLAVNPVAATGGAEPETLGDAAKRTAHEWRKPTRTVTIGDFEYAATNTPGAAIARAFVAVGYHPQHPCVSVDGAVTVFVAPDVPRPDPAEWASQPAAWSAPMPDPATLCAVRRHVERVRLLTQEVFVGSPFYDDVAVTVSIDGQPANVERIRAAITAELFQFFHPIWGGPEDAGWPFGGDIYPSAVMQRVQRILPAGLLVHGASIARWDACSPPTECEPLVIAAFTLPNLKEVHVHFAPSPSEEGGLG